MPSTRAPPPCTSLPLPSAPTSARGAPAGAVGTEHMPGPPRAPAAPPKLSGMLAHPRRQPTRGARGPAGSAALTPRHQDGHPAALDDRIRTRAVQARGRCSDWERPRRARIVRITAGSVRRAFLRRVPAAGTSPRVRLNPLEGPRMEPELAPGFLVRSAPDPRRVVDRVGA